MSTKSDFSDISHPAWHPERPYNTLPDPPPSDRLEVRAVLLSCIEARAALAELKQASELIPNPRMLINTLPLLEARASSEIENIVTTADRLFETLDAVGTADPATREAHRYRLALVDGSADLERRPLSTRTAEVVCSAIKGMEMSVRRVPGTQLANTMTGQIIYTPPEGESLLRDKLGSWERFLHERDDLDPLIRLAAGHYQFEAIHPFVDGNGRTGRVLNSLFLVQEGLLPAPILYFSRYIIRTKQDYYDRLLAVTRDEAWETWLLYMLEGIRETSRWTLDKIAAIRELQEQTVEFLRDKLPKIYSRELVDVLFEQPYCRIGHLENRVAKRQTASRYLKSIAELGVLDEKKRGRDKLFVNSRLMHLLTNEDNTIRPFA